MIRLSLPILAFLPPQPPSTGPLLGARKDAHAQRQHSCTREPQGLCCAHVQIAPVHTHNTIISADAFDGAAGAGAGTLRAPENPKDWVRAPPPPWLRARSAGRVVLPLVGSPNPAPRL